VRVVDYNRDSRRAPRAGIAVCVRTAAVVAGPRLCTRAPGAGAAAERAGSGTVLTFAWCMEPRCSRLAGVGGLKQVLTCVRSVLLTRCVRARRWSRLAALTAGCVAVMLSRGATAFMQAGRARLMTTGLRSAAASRSWRTPAAGASVARSRRMARLSSSSGITTAKMVATDIFPDLKGAAIMEKFEHVKEDVVEEYGAKVVLFRHKKTGAEVMSVSVPDENKVFGITFRTPPSDSTGIPHILEHSVLCGSRKYPVKEPFVELLKGSLNTFLNAFTYPDRTCYPVASQVCVFFFLACAHSLSVVMFVVHSAPRILRNKPQRSRKISVSDIVLALATLS
jgi:hypothetical protein